MLNSLLKGLLFVRRIAQLLLRLRTLLLKKNDQCSLYSEKSFTGLSVLTPAIVFIFDVNRGLIGDSFLCFRRQPDPESSHRPQQCPTYDQRKKLVQLE